MANGIQNINIYEISSKIFFPLIFLLVSFITFPIFVTSGILPLFGIFSHLYSFYWFVYLSIIFN